MRNHKFEKRVRKSKVALPKRIHRQERRKRQKRIKRRKQRIRIKRK